MIELFKVRGARGRALSRAPQSSKYPCASNRRRPCRLFGRSKTSLSGRFSLLHSPRDFVARLFYRDFVFLRVHTGNFAPKYARGRYPIILHIINRDPPPCSPSRKPGGGSQRARTFLLSFLNIVLPVLRPLRRSRDISYGYDIPAARYVSHDMFRKAER